MSTYQRITVTLHRITNRHDKSISSRLYAFSLGIIKKLYLHLWYFGHPDKKLKPRYCLGINQRIEHLSKWAPCEFQRKPRKLVAQLKASELRLILLYIGPVLLKGILSSQIYQHFCLLHVAFRILCSKNFISFFINYA